MMEEIQARIRERAGELRSLANGGRTRLEEEPQQAEDENADRVEEIRQSVTDEAVRERVERISRGGEMMTETLEARFQTQTIARTQEFSRIKEVVSGWSG